MKHKQKEIQIESQFLTPEEIVEFKYLVIQEKGIELSLNEALDQGSRLIMLFEALQKFGPIQLSGKDVVESTGQNDKIKEGK